MGLVRVRRSVSSILYTATWTSSLVSQPVGNHFQTTIMIRGSRSSGGREDGK